MSSFDFDFDFDYWHIKILYDMIEPGRAIPFSTYNKGVTRSTPHPSLKEKINDWKKIP